ncbi:MAG: hypothetical protein ACK5LO_10755 [Leucobacter sp.]
MSRRSRVREAPVTVLTVCIGNICRSPLAEQLLRAGLDGDARFEFGSAGLHTSEGIPMDRHSAQQSLEHGGVPDGALSSVLADGHAQASDLILTMTLGQRDELIERHPRALLRTFTLAEFAGLLTALEAERPSRSAPATPNQIRELVELASRNRARVSLTRADDVPDPVNASVSVHQAVAAQIAGYTAQIARLLR